MEQTPLRAACSTEKKDIAVTYLQTKEVNVYRVDEKGNTPMKAASGEGHEEIAHFIIDRGIEFDQIDVAVCTPLTPVCNKRHEEIVHFLNDKKN